MREKSVKRLQICPKCAGYMQPLSPFAAGAEKRDWKDETHHRSFGGIAVKKFVCEKCHHVEVFQYDDLDDIEEDS